METRFYLSHLCDVNGDRACNVARRGECPYHTSEDKAGRCPRYRAERRALAEIDEDYLPPCLDDVAVVEIVAAEDDGALNESVNVFGDDYGVAPAVEELRPGLYRLTAPQ